MSAGRPASFQPLLISTGVRTAALRTPDKVALSTRTRAVRYRELVERFNRLANLGRHGLGLAKGDHVALMAPNCIEFVEITCGLADAGIAPAMISPQASPREIGYICGDAQARVLFVHHSLEERARAADLPGVERFVVIGRDYDDLVAQAAATAPDMPLEEWDVFSIPYTSGTTGEPKGVLLSHRSRTFHMLFALGVNHGCYQPIARGLAMSPFFNGAGFINALAPAYFGGTCHILEKFEPEAVLAAIDERSITTMFMVPTHFHAIFNLGPAALGKYDVSSLVAINCNAAPLPQATKERIVAHFGDGKLFEAYGATETGGITSLRPEDQLRKQVCVGLPLIGVEMRVVGEDGALVRQGEVGEIAVRSPWLFNGYWNKPEQTAAALREGWYHTGDLGRQDEEGYLYLVDRKKNVIISGGQNIFPREVEEVLYRHPAVAEAAVVGKRDDYWGEAVTAYVVARPGQVVDYADIKAHCARQLAGYKLPKSVHVVEQLPKNGTGKILHRVVRDWANGVPAADAARA